MNITDFLKEIYSGCAHGYLTILTLPERQVSWFPIKYIEKAAAKAQKAGQSTNTYFGVGLRRQPLPNNHRGGNNDITVIPALYADIDIKGSAHVEEALPQTEADAVAFLKSLPMHPTFIVNSGNGLHAYWKLDKPFVISSDEHRMELSRIVKGWGKYINNEAEKHGWRLDAVYDLARVLRVAGTLNHKNADKAKCYVMEHTSIKYAIDDFKEYKDASKDVSRDVPKDASKDNNDRTVIEKGISGSSKQVIEKCTFMQYCRDNAEKLTEPLWHAMISNLSLTADGEKTVHELSKPYPKYNRDETDKKIRRAIKENKPHTCKYIKESLGFKCSNGCRVKAPIVYSLLSREERVKSLVENPDTNPDVLYSEEVLSLMHYAKERLPVEYIKFKAKIKGSVNLRDFENAVNYCSINNISNISSKSNTQIYSDNTPLNLKGISLNGAVTPYGWLVSMEDGVQKITTGKDGTTTAVVCPSALAVTKRLENIDDESEKIELSFFRNGRWKSILAPRSQIFNKTSIIKFADSGLPVSSDSSGDVVKYLWDYENANLKAIPFVRSVGRIGWMKNEFFPYATERPIIFESEYKEAGDIIKSLKKQGDLEKWMSAGNIVRKNNFARFLLAASFASPLLEHLGHRVFFIHIWHDSKSGKTASIKYAVSVWGNPQKLMGSFNATSVGLERMAGTLKHLPFAIDELQVLNERRLSVETIVYSLGNGFGRMRGTKDGGIQDVPDWRNILITSGEQPMSKDTSNDGVITRVLELYGKPIADEDLAHELHLLSENNYGFAGQTYIRYIISSVLSKKGRLQNDFEAIYTEIKKQYVKVINGRAGGHLDNIAAVCLGDYYASISVFGIDEQTAFEEAVRLGVSMLENNKTLEKEDTIVRAWTFIVQWVASNKGRFSHDAVPCYGAIEGNQVYININILREALENAGFDYSKATRGLKDRGYFNTSLEADGSNRMQVQKRINGVNSRWFHITLDLGNEEIKPLIGNQNRYFK